MNLYNQKSLHGILDGISFPVLYKISYLANYYREPILKEFQLQYDLSRYEIFILLFLGFSEGISASQICEFSGHLKNNISRATTSLEKKDLIFRKQDHEDARKSNLFLTNRGKEISTSFDPKFMSREQEILSILDEDERTAFEDTLRKLCKSLLKDTISDGS